MRIANQEGDSQLSLNQMTFPTILFAILIAIFYGAVFHFFRGGGGWRLLLFIGLSILGFAAGQLVGAWRGWLILMLGPINLGLGTLGSFIFMILGGWLSHVEGKRESKV